jgi:hypothetical protein
MGAEEVEEFLVLDEAFGQPQTVFITEGVKRFPPLRSDKRCLCHLPILT